MQLPEIYQKLLLSLVLLIVTIVLYWPVLDDEFVWDAEILHQDSSLNSLDNLFSGFTAQAMTLSRENGKLTNNLKYYRPFTRALHVIEHQFFGIKPFAYKLTNVVLHAMVAILLFILVASMLGSIPVAFFSALLFLVKPIHTEAVAWTYSDSYLLVAFFSLTSLLAFRSRKTPVAIAAFLLAMLSHEMGVLLLPILCLYAVLVERLAKPKELLPLAPYAMLTVAYLGLRHWVVGPIPLPDIEPAVFANTAAFIFAKYLKIFVWPDAPVTIYLQQLHSVQTAYVIAGYLLLLLSIWVAWLLWRRDRVILFWFLWFFVWSAVSYNIGRFGAYMMAEKIIYLSSAGLSVVLVALLLRNLKEYQSLVYAGLTGIVLLNAVNLSWRLPHWHDTVSYVKKALEHAPDFPIGWYTLGHKYRLKGDYTRAQEAFEQVIVYDESFSLAHNNIGNIHYMQGRVPQALEYWQKAKQYDPTNPQPYFNIGMAMQQLGQAQEALNYYERYLSMSEKPDPRAVGMIKQLRHSLESSAAP